MNETDIQNQIRIALSEYGVVFRTNAGKFYQGMLIYSKEFKQNVLIDLTVINGLPKGFSDLLFIGDKAKGYDTAFVETKTLTGRPSTEQLHFIELMQSLGHQAGIARSVQDALEIINLENLCPHGYRDWDQCPVCCH
jgi:hypothetical protein